MIVYIMRGLPGSGKSTRAKELDPTRENTCSTDDYHYVNGVYKWQPEKLQFYHGLNFQKFLVMIAEKRPVVVVDNTNVQSWQYEEYVKAAKMYGYEVRFERFSPLKEDGTVDWDLVNMYADRNSHGCSRSACARMALAWQEENVIPAA